MNSILLKQKFSSACAVATSRRFLAALLGWTFAGAMTLIGFALLVLWSTSVGSTDFVSIPTGSTELQLGSSNGSLMVGVFDTTPRGWGWRRNTITLFSVHPDNDNSINGFAAVGNLSGWAIAVPHLVVVAAVLVVPAWWVLVVRNRRDIDHRRENGLCHACGYDVRESRETCPECGEAVWRGRPRYNGQPAAA